MNPVGERAEGDRALALVKPRVAPLEFVQGELRVLRPIAVLVGLLPEALQLVAGHDWITLMNSGGIPYRNCISYPPPAMPYDPVTRLISGIS
jgi:hypothetical protein